VTPDDYQQVWRRLALPASNSQLEAAETPSGSGIWVARDQQNRQHLLVRVPDDAKINLSETHGLGVAIARPRIPDEPDATYVDLACLDQGAAPTFAAVAADIAAGAVDAVPERRLAAITTALSKWRWFWGVDPTRLSATYAIGLFGELWFLIRWARPSVTSIEAWQGSDGSRHDFQWAERSVEVKTTSRSGAIVHTIQQLEQLEDPEQGLLYLYSLRLARDSLAGNTLNSLVEIATSAVADQPQTRSDLQAKLGRRGYTPATRELAAIAYRVVEEALYVVGTGFPRLTRASFGGQLPHGIAAVSYQLDMAACHAWRIDTSAENWPPT
jgi:hypothetical protein